MSETAPPPGSAGTEPAAEVTSTRNSVIHQLVSVALHQPLLVLTASVVAAAVGLWSFSRLPVDAYPDISPPRVGIITQWPGRAAEEVERLITVPIETEMNGLPNVEVLRSVSFFGLSSVDVIFKDGTDN